MVDSNANMVVGQSSKSKFQKFQKKNFKNDFKRTAKHLALKGKDYKKRGVVGFMKSKEGSRLSPQERLEF
ncbi:hypothetical protein Syun_024028 [Stephania yunnanensis]|uniref:Uncharacterized protein n=1 Tax=Stephania yunnanensis TaxID=152371 RepID=A0AAP0FKI9_9MAGN